MSFIPQDRITNAAASKIKKSVFEFLEFETGSAICVSSSSWNLNIERCLFRFCISTNVGGAINVKAATLLFVEICFDTCFIAAGVKNLFGNVIYGTSDYSKNAVLNYTTFLCCGPKMSISADSTIYFQKFISLLSNLNFSRCCSTEGSCSISIESPSGKATFVDIFEGISAQITCVFGSGILSFSKSNIIDWTPYVNYAIFWSDYGKTTLEDCSFFILNPTYKLGSVAFLRNCYGNVASNITKTVTTRISMLKIRADDYCNHVNLDFSSNDKGLGFKLLSIPLIFF